MEPGSIGSSGRGFRGRHHDDFNLQGDQRRAVPPGVLLPDIIAVLVRVDEAVKRATIGGGLLINRKINRVSDYSRMTSSWPATVIGFSMPS
jgi:hypothetical protein